MIYIIYIIEKSYKFSIASSFSIHLELKLRTAQNSHFNLWDISQGVDNCTIAEHKLSWVVILFDIVFIICHYVA